MGGVENILQHFLIPCNFAAASLGPTIESPVKQQELTGQEKGKKAIVQE